MLLEWMKLSSDWLQEKNAVCKDHRTQAVLLNTHQHQSSAGKLWIYVAAEDLDILQPLLATGPPQWFSSCLTANGIQEQDDGFDLASKVHGCHSPEHSQKKYRSVARIEVSTCKVWDTKQPKSASCCKGIAGHPATNTGLRLCRRPAIPNTNLISNDTRRWDAVMNIAATDVRH